MGKKKKDPSSSNIRGKNVIGSIHASGHAQVDVTQNSNHKTEDKSFERLFALLEEQVKTRPEDPNVDKQEIRNVINEIKAEAAQGEKANPNKLERWIRNLAGIAPDVVDIILASLGGPLSGFTAVLQKIAARVKAEAGNKG